MYIDYCDEQLDNTILRLNGSEMAVLFLSVLEADRRGISRLTPLVKDEMSSRTLIKKRAVDDNLRNLVDKGLMKKLSASDFMVNPYYMTNALCEDVNIFKAKYDNLK